MSQIRNIFGLAKKMEMDYRMGRGFNEQQLVMLKPKNERASSLIESEGAFYEEYNLAVARQFYRQLNTRLQQVERAGGFLLNIGWGGGWEDENRAQHAHRGLRRRVRADPTALPVGAPAQGVS